MSKNKLSKMCPDCKSNLVKKSDKSQNETIETVFCPKCGYEEESKRMKVRYKVLDGENEEWT